MTMEQLQKRRAERVTLLEQTQKELAIAQANVQRVMGALAELDLQIAELQKAAKEQENGEKLEHADNGNRERGDDQRGS